MMGMLADRRDELGRARTQVINRLHRLLLELLPGGAKKFLSARQARAMLASVRLRDLVGKTRRRLAAELISELEAIDSKTRALDRELTGLVIARGSTLMDLHGIGPSGAARLLADAGDIHRFAGRDRFASWNGTAPLDASSGSQVRRCRSRLCYLTGPAGALPSVGARLPEPCRVMTPGLREPAACEGPVGEGIGLAVSVTAPIPAVRGRAFSCPWLCGTRGARTCRGRRWPGTALHSAYPLVSSVLPRIEGERSVKPSAQPTLVRTQHLPPPAKTAR